ncbi:complement C1q tumor necrosis factor-related protein 5-like [Ruditapes philippinarum]|uniref:complement C1q tumor necrosis factor-related protein 5-like n=1 Tax=Ruditapes philippinarum TaxID=129788 RepID=UPI00295AAFFC|nr:complement C1q tumor necrosis factor-related protein 5-like [Ruditapes philippinarum]
MVNEIKKTEDNVISTLGDIKQTVSDFTDMFVDMRRNITDDMLRRSDEIKMREESFKTLFEETRNSLTIGIDSQKEELIKLQESLKKRFEETRNNLTSDIDAKKEELNQIQGKLDQPQIAFYAHHLKDLALDTTNEILIFEKTFTNEGTGYDASTGLFTAPVGGLYQFDVHTCAAYRKDTYLGLVLEGNVIAANANYGDASDGCSNFGAIVRVKSGAQVWVKSTSSGSNRQLYQNIYRMNTFSGLLVNY